MSPESNVHFIVTIITIFNNTKRGIGTMISPTKLITVADVFIQQQIVDEYGKRNIYKKPKHRGPLDLQVLTSFYDKRANKEQIKMPVIDYIIESTYEYKSYKDNAALLIVSFFSFLS